MKNIQFKSSRILIVLVFFILFLSFACSQNSNNENNENKNQSEFLNSFLNFKTVLNKKIKAPQEFYGLPEHLENMDIIYYHSDSLKLKAFLWNKNIDSNKRKPALIYFHGGFSVDSAELYLCKQFIENGFIVFTPTYRGEIDNPGYFEFFLGEVKDARESVKWLVKQPYIDTTRIYTFGHSIGGGISLMLSFHNDLPIKISGSCGGLYDPDAIRSFNESNISMPFEINNQKEQDIRLPFQYLNLMSRKHYMYSGNDDEYTQSVKKLVQQVYKNKTIKLEFINVEGNHISSLDNSLNEFYNLIQKSYK